MTISQLKKYELFIIILKEIYFQQLKNKKKYIFLQKRQ